MFGAGRVFMWISRNYLQGLQAFFEGAFGYGFGRGVSAIIRDKFQQGPFDRHV
jgi:hypothetical protein